MSEQRLRTALRELGDVPAPADLAGGALARARRDRRRTVVALAVVAVVTAVAVTVPAVLLHRRTAEPPASVPPRFFVSGFASWDRAEPTSGGGRPQLYDRSAAGYAASRWSAAVPAPDGRMVAVISGTGRVGLVAADRAGDPAAVRWTATTVPGRTATWAPDGGRLLAAGVTRIDHTAGRVTARATVIDARTAAGRALTLRWAQHGTVSGWIIFGPQGEGWAAGPPAIRLPGGSDALQLFDRRGRLLRTVPVGPGRLPDQPFSPDGRLVAVAELGSTRVIELASGTERGTLDGAAVGWYDDDRLVVLAGRVVRVVDVGSGRVLAERTLVAPGRELTGVWLAPLDGPPPPGAITL